MIASPHLPGALLGRLKLRQLALVLAIEETRTLHRAAARLALSQPNATRLLRDMEDTLGTPLFRRLPHGMTATASGQVVIGHARLIFSDVARMQDAIAGLRDGIAGTVRIGAVTAALADILADAVAALTAAHPTLALGVVTDTSEALLEALQAGRLDIVIGRSLDPVPDLHVEYLAEEALCVVCAPDHPLVGRPVLTLADLIGEHWILQPAPSPMRRAVETIFALAQLRLPPHPVEAASVTATLTLLDRTRLLAVLPQSLGQYFARSGLLAELPVPLPRVLAPYALITRAGASGEPALSRVMDALRRAAGRDRDARPDPES